MVRANFLYSAGETMVDVTVNMSAPGLSGMVKDSGKINENLKQAAENSTRIAGPVRAASAPSGTGETKTARSIGAGAGTGSASSDFAAQASGLGGLVHVYATFAANIFAVSAAFSALSKAMDIANLTKGLDQLGAASGRSLGGIAKQMVIVTDGAISLRQAMTSTALASSGGISNENMLRLTEVAKKASIALGRDLPDSMDRLTKGIVKTQPELLDELGIMTRVIPAHEAYARSIGKSVSSLTTFEKQQAFTNAVLTEGENKFKNIDLVSNPYSKLAASTDNLLQSGLELVNHVLGPIINLLASSPTALATALAAISFALLNQALPAIGAFRQNLQKLADESRDMAVARAAEARKGHEEAYKTAKSAALDQAKMELDTAKRNAEAVAEQKVASVEAVEKKISGYKNIVRKGSAAEKILSKDLPDVTDQDIARLELNAKQQASNKKAADLQMEYARTLREYKQSEVDYAAKEIAATEAKTAAEQKYNQEAQIAAKQQINNLGIMSTLKQNQVIADRALLSSVSQSITAQAANTAATKGFGAAIAEAWQSVNKAWTGKAVVETYIETIDAAGKKTKELATITAPAMSGIQGGWTLLKAGIAGATGALTTFLNFIGPWMQGIGLIIAAFQVLNGLVSKSREANENFNASIDLMTSGIKNAGDTLDRLKLVGFNESMSVDALQARANAFASLSDSMNPAIDNFNKLEKLKNPLENFIDNLYHIFGKSDSDELYKGIAKSINKSFQLIEDPKLKKDYQTAMSEIFGSSVDLGNLDKLKDTISNLTGQARLDALQKAADKQKAFSKEINISASAGVDFKNSLQALSQQVTDYTTKLLPTDDYAKFGIALAKIVDILNSKYLTSLASVSSLQTEIKANPILGIFAQDAILQIEAITTQVERLNKAKTDLVKESIVNNSNLNLGGPASTPSLFKQLGSGSTAVPKIQITPTIDTVNQSVVNQAAKLADINKDLAVNQTAQVNAQAKLIEKMKASAEEYLGYSEKRAKIEGAIAIQQARISIAGSYGGPTATESRSVILQEAQLKREDIKQQFKMYNAQQSNTEAIINLTEALDLSTAKNGVTITGKKVDEILQTRADREKLNAAGGSIEKQAIARLEKSALDKVDKETYAKLLVNTNQGEKENFALKQSQLDIDAKSLTLAKQKIDLQTQYTQGFSQSLSDAALQTELDLTSNKYKKERNDLQDKITGSTLASEKSYRDQLQAQIDLNKKTETQEKLALRVNAAYNAAQKSLAEEVRLLDTTLEISKLKNDLANEKDKAEKDSLTYYRELGAITESELLKATAQLDIQKSIRDEQDKQAQIARDKKQQLGELSNKEKAAKLAAGGGINAGTLSEADQKKYDDERAAIEQKASLRSTTAAATAIAEQSSIDRNTTLKALYADQSDAMLKMQSVTENLAAVFGTLGDSIGKAGEALLKMSQDDTNYLNAKQRLQDQIADARSPDQEAAAIKKLNTLENNYAITKDKNSRTALTNVKNLFGQETAAYKIITGLEKAKAALTLGNQVEMLQTTIQNTKKLITETIPGIYATALAYLGPVAGPIAATAAIAAFVGSEFGGGGSSAPAFNYQDYQKQQGTYETGLNQNGGDPTALNTALKDSLNMLVSYAKPELPLTSKMARHLENIDGKIQDFVAYQLNDIGTANANFNPSYSKTGTSALAGVGVGAALGAGAGAALSGLAGLGASLMSTTAFMSTFGTTIAGAGFAMMETVNVLGDLLMPGLGTVAGALIGLSPGLQQFATNLLFGSTEVFTGLQGLGLEIDKQTLGMASSNLQLQNYADILTTTVNHVSDIDRWTGGHDSESNALIHKLSPADQKLKAALEDMYGTIKNSMTLAANALKLPTSQIDNLVVSFKDIGLVTGDAKGNLEKVNAYFGNMSDELAKQLIPDIQKYTQGTETTSQTYYRLAASQEEASYYAEKLGIKTANYTEIINKHGDASAEILKKSILDSTNATQSIKDIIETYSGKAGDIAAVYTSLMDVQRGLIAIGGSSKLVNADMIAGAGGVDALNASWGSFQDTYLTTGEKRFQQQVKMDQEFKKLGLVTPKTAQGFKDLVLSLMAGGAANSKTLGSVLALTDGMNKLVGGIDDASNSLKTTISNFTSFGDNIKKYRESLALGANSVATSGEKLALAKSQFDTTLSKAMAGDTAAQGNLTNLASTVLDLGKSIFASSPDYVKLYNEISDKLQTAQLNATQTVDTATLQLNQATTQTGLLTSINQNITDFLNGTPTAGVQQTQQSANTSAMDSATTAITDAVQPAILSITKILENMIGKLFTPHAAGGLARGMSLVGERGPELVDFTMPGQVYTADQTRGMFVGNNNNNMGASITSMVLELQQLRQEVCQLRKDQQKQTGDIIISNYDANEKASTQVADAVAQTSNDAQWAARTIPVIK